MEKDIHICPAQRTYPFPISLKSRRINQEVHSMGSGFPNSWCLNQMVPFSSSHSSLCDILEFCYSLSYSSTTPQPSPCRVFRYFCEALPVLLTLWCPSRKPPVLIGYALWVGVITSCQRQPGIYIEPVFSVEEDYGKLRSIYITEGHFRKCFVK